MNTWLGLMVKKYGKPEYTKWQLPCDDVPGYNFYNFQRAWTSEKYDLITVSLSHHPVDPGIYSHNRWSVYVGAIRGIRVDVESENPITDAQIVGALTAAGVL